MVLVGVDMGDKHSSANGTSGRMSANFYLVFKDKFAIFYSSSGIACLCRLTQTRNPSNELYYIYF